MQVAIEERAAQGDDRGILVVGGGASLIGMIAVKLRVSVWNVDGQSPDGYVAAQQLMALHI